MARQRFDRWAPRYDRGLRARFFFRPLHSRLLALLAALPGQRVLDVGCGTGSMVAALLGAGVDAVGVDPSGEMVRVATTKATGRFAVATAESLPFPDGRFDVVLTSMSLHHWHHAERGIAEAARVLARGGRLLVADTRGGGVAERLAHLIVARDHDAHYVGEDDRARLLRGAGIEPTESRIEMKRVLVTLGVKR